ncbi:MAG: transcriptional regulator NrdR [Deltaproteobacteria bacterium]|nr:transcriptional regulator NrdR [Deltaproteobacteria bacterium]
MKCPECGYIDTSVIDSRIAREGLAIRRRRECPKCKKRFTTYEQIEDATPMVIKKDGRREPFDRQKIKQGLLKACEKRPISIDTIERAVNRIAQKYEGSPDKEIPTSDIGEELMAELKELDKVAYVRFASVYREFKDISEFMDELKGLLKTKFTPKETAQRKKSRP